uniref:Uncharacterized protein n=1 Tax=Brassica campestris TaxID=3711 RepID=M4F057_BRACM
MLFAAEGGGFFSSSASGYSNGLALLLLGHKDEPKPVIVSPWRHYHLVVEETDTKFQLDSSKKWLCTSLTCFGRKSDRPDNPSQPHDFPSDKRDGAQQSVDYECCSNRFALKSSLKKRSFSDALLADDDVSRDNGVLNHADRRKVQWPDTCGIEIAEVREFEPRFYFALNEYAVKWMDWMMSCIMEIEKAAEGPLLLLLSGSLHFRKNLFLLLFFFSTAVAVDGKSVVTVEFQRQKAKRLQEYFKQKKLEAAAQGPFFGFQPKNEISNGRWAMFGFAVGLLTDYKARLRDYPDIKGDPTDAFISAQTHKIQGEKKTEYNFHTWTDSAPTKSNG